MYYTYKGTSTDYYIFYNKDKKAYAYYKCKLKASYCAIYKAEVIVKGRVTILEIDAIEKVDYNDFYNKTIE